MKYFARIFLICMNKIITILKDNRQSLRILSIIFAMCILISVFCIHSFTKGIIFFLFIAIAVVLPGKVISYLIFDKYTELERLALSFILGYAFSILQYFLFAIMGIYKSGVWIVLFETVLFCTYLYRKEYHSIETNEECKFDFRVVTFFIVAMFGISFFAIAGNSMVPPFVRRGSPYVDLIYWTQDIIELAREFPPKDPRAYDNAYTYHYFAAAQMAYASWLTGIRSIYLALFFSIAQSIPLRILSGFLIVKSCTSNNKKLIIGMVLLFFASGFEGITLVTYSAHMFHGPFGVEYGYALFMFCIWSMKRLDSSEKSDIKQSILIWIIVFVTAGLKIAYGAVALTGLGILCFCWLIQKKLFQAFFTGIPALVIFIVEYFIIINTSRYSSGGPNVSYPLFSPIVTTYPKIVQMGRYLEYYLKVNTVVANFISVIICAIMICPIAFSFFCLCVEKKTIQHKWKPMDFAMLSFVIAGFAVYISCTMYGGSNMYFALVCIPVPVIWYLQSDIKVRKPTKVLLILLGLLSVGCLVKGYDADNSLIQYISDGANKIFARNQSKGFIDERTYVDEEQYAAYEWLRTNTETTDLIASNRKSGMICSMSERIVDRLTEENTLTAASSISDQERVLDYYRQKDIKYVIYDNQYDGNDELLSMECEPVYKTENIVIYQVG